MRVGTLLVADKSSILDCKSALSLWGDAGELPFLLPHPKEIKMRADATDFRHWNFIMFLLHIRELNKK